MQNGINVIIVKIPLNPALIERIDAQSIDNFDVYLEETSSKYNLTVFDYFSAYNSSYFYDGHHLNRIGKERFSKSLGSKVVGALENAV